jgi:hypothetical protein
VHHLHHICSQSLEHTVFSPYYEHQERQPYRDYEVQIYPVSYFRASIIRREVPECRTEKGCDESPGKEDESDSGNQSHVGSVAMVELVVSLLKSRVYLSLLNLYWVLRFRDLQFVSMTEHYPLFVRTQSSNSE